MLTPYSTKVYLNIEKASKDGKCPIYIRIICNRKKTELSTNIFVFEKQWDASRNIVKKEPALNQEISAILNEINGWMKVMTASGKAVDLAEIRKLVKGKANIYVTLYEYTQQYLSYLENNPMLKPASVVQYKATVKHILDFIDSCNYRHLYLKDVTTKLIMDFDLFLKNVILPTGNRFELITVNKHHSRFRTILIKAQHENLLDKNPYSLFKLKKVESMRVALTREELEAIIQLDLSENLSLDRVKDIFIFSVYTGLRFEDAQNITRQHIHKNPNGNFELRLNQQKTGEYASIPLLTPAMTIIDKYSSQVNLDGKGRILPKISNQKTNVYLKVIADLAGINKKLTHHIARHTCATTILLQNGAPIEAVSKWLGHKNYKTTQIYAKINNDYLHKIANAITDKL